MPLFRYQTERLGEMIPQNDGAHLTQNPDAGQTAADLVCSRCGYSELWVYEGELVRCPHCDTILDATPPEPVSWLAQWPTTRRSTVANLFYIAIRRGATSPPAIVEQVADDIYQRLMWTSDPDKRHWWGQVLTTLHDDPRGAQGYAAEVLAREQLPAAEHAAQKREQAKGFVLAAMKGKPVTEKQLRFLRSLGHAGPLPSDRAEASELIDGLMRRTGGKV
jgi:hypothetical protein